MSLMEIAIEAEAAGLESLLRLVAAARAGSELAARSLEVWRPWAARQRAYRLQAAARRAA